jgi:putative exosortase-associated protein (TIGR04073 family)
MKGIARKSTIIVVVMAFAFLVASSGPIKAQTYDPAKDLPKPTVVEKALNKLGRGISNFFLGWAEIPVTMDRGIQEGRSLGYLVGVAPVLGTARAVMRTGVGVYEAATFPVSDKQTKFNAIIEPEYIF